MRLLSVLTLMVLAFSANAQEKKGKEVPFVEPTEVRGKTFKEWVKEIHARDPAHRNDAMMAVIMFGPDRAMEAVPEIIKELNRHKTTNVDLAVRVKGIVTIGEIIKHQKKPDPAILKDALGVFKMGVRDTQSIMRMHAMEELPALGPIAHELFEEVLYNAHDPLAWELRKQALQTLTIISANEKGMISPKLLPELKRALDDVSVEVRLTALTALGMMAHLNLPKTDEQLILLKLNSHLTSETDSIGKIWTHVTIMSASKDVSKKHVAPIAGYLKDGDSKVRNQAVTALAQVGPKAKPWCLEAVEEATGDPDAGVAWSAVVALVKLEAAESIPVLERIVNNKKTTQAMREHAEDAVDHLKMSRSKPSEK